jgi:hypothetical protein
MHDNETIRRLVSIKEELRNTKEEIGKSIAYIERLLIDLEYDIREEQDKMADELYEINKKENDNV